MSSFVVGRSSTILLNLSWFVGPDPVLDATATVRLQDTNSPEPWYLDWDDLTFKASGHTKLLQALTNNADGTYSVSLGLGNIGLHSQCTILEARYDASAPAQTDLTSFDDFSLVSPATVIPGITGGPDPYAMLAADLVTVLGDPVSVTPVGGSALAVQAKFDIVGEEVPMAGGIAGIVDTPFLTYREVDVGVGLEIGSAVVVAGASYVTSNPPRSTGKGLASVPLQKA